MTDPAPTAENDATTFIYRASLAPTGQDYEDAREEIASLIREKVAKGLRAATNDSIRQGYALVIDALYVEWAEREVLRERLASLLHDTANAVKGEPEPLTDHSWHDLPEAAAALRTRVFPPGQCPDCGEPVYVAAKWGEWACSDPECVRAHGPGPGGGYVIPPGEGDA